MHFRAVSQLVGVLLVLLAGVMGLHAGLGALWGEPEAAAALGRGGLVTLAIAAGLLALGGLRPRGAEIRHRDAFVLVSAAWVAVSVLGGLPYLFASGGFGGFTNAVFESTSGFTTTGASILSDIEAVPHSLLMWRASTHWIGGMGIILLTVAVLPLLGVAGMQLVRAEGVPTDEKLQPRIRETARALWRTYLVLTVAQVVLLMVFGMGLFDAVAHTFATVATGGFSTRNKSVESFDSPAIEAVIAVFMVLSAVNFALHFRVFAPSARAAQLARRQGWGARLRDALRVYTGDTEFRVYVWVLLLSSAVVVGDLLWADHYGLAEAFRFGVFNVVSILTTTGFSNHDFGAWLSVHALAPLVLVLLMVIGGSTGSTSGAIKIARFWVVAKEGGRELFRQIHPRAVAQVRMGERLVDPGTVRSVVSFVVLYVATIGVGTLLLSATGLDLVSSGTAAASCLGGVGPGLASVGPAANYAHLLPFAKWTLVALMILGRVELYTLLVMLVPSFWRG